MTIAITTIKEKMIDKVRVNIVCVRVIFTMLNVISCNGVFKLWPGKFTRLYSIIHTYILFLFLVICCSISFLFDK